MIGGEKENGMKEEKTDVFLIKLASEENGQGW